MWKLCDVGSVSGDAADAQLTRYNVDEVFACVTRLVHQSQRIDVTTVFNLHNTRQRSYFVAVEFPSLVLFLVLSYGTSECCCYMSEGRCKKYTKHNENHLTQVYP